MSRQYWRETIVIASPTRDSFSSGFTYDLFELQRYELDKNSSFRQIFFAVSQGTLLCNQRTELVKTAIEANASHILFIDSDMRFSAETLTNLRSHNKDVIAANCSHRQARKSTAIKDGEAVLSADKTGIMEVDSLGFGVCLINLQVFKNLNNGVWFATPYDGEKYVTDDRYFCHVAKEAGYKLWIDHDLSKKIKHIGAIEHEVV